MQAWIIVHLHTMPFSAGAALRTIRSTTNGASIAEPKGLCSWQAPGIRAPARGHSCRPAGLRPGVLAALRPLDVDAGVYQRAPHGYRVHTAMIRFSWASTSVDDKIQALPKKTDRRRATKAPQHSLTCTDSAYKTFYDMHLDFLRKHGTCVKEKLRKLLLSFLETPGLNALSGLNSIGITTSARLSRKPTMKIAGNDDEPRGSSKPATAPPTAMQALMNRRKPTAAKHPQTLE